MKYNMAEKILSRQFMVKPSESNAQQELPLTMLMAQIIELATDHANLLGIGFLNMEPKGLGWVLSRVSIEMNRWPKTGEKYILSTWIESWNSHFSDRCFSIQSENGEMLGYARTVWVIIDLKGHKSVGTAGLQMPAELIDGTPCPIPRMQRHKVFENANVTNYTFKYTDIDFYRHVNTVRYIALLLNLYSLEDFDTSVLSRLDIGFAREAKFGEVAQIRWVEEKTDNPSLFKMEGESTKRSFEILVESNTILTASIVMTRVNQI